jgi:SAM-dependent methyltransferase
MTGGTIPGGGDGYDPAFFDTLDAVEDWHFWFRARRRAVAAVLRGLVSQLRPGYHCLELGCGNGGMLRVLQSCCTGGHVYGMDLYAEGLANAARRTSCPLVRGDVRRPPFSEAFDVVGMFDVLEHLQDDVAVLENARTMLAPGGRLLLTVPAHMELWSYFDEASRHVRRYTAAVLAERVRAAGLVMEYQTEYMSWIYPFAWLGRRVNGGLRWRHGRRTGVGEAFELTRAELRVVPVINGMLDWCLSGEADLIARRRQISRGTSLIAVARRA